MSKKLMLLVGGAGLALMGFGEPSIKDRSVLGRWTFNDGASSADVSGWGGSAFTVKSGTMSFKESGSFDGSGYLDITSSGSATATLGGGNELGDSSYQTVFVRYKSNCSISLTSLQRRFLDEKEVNYIDKLNDNGNWHLVLLRYQASAGTYGSTKWRSAVDPANRSWWDSSSRSDVGSDSKILIPASVSGSTVTVGGNVGVSSYTTGYKGCIDEVVVIGRLMSLDELSRYYQTGETFAYPTATPSFAAATGWSSVENNWRPKPGDMPGAAYIVDDNKTMTQDGTATFGVDVANRVSLTLGRKAPLTFIDGNTEVTKQVAGNFNHSSAGTLTFYDLRLVNGKFTGVAGGALNTTLLDIDTPSGSAFEFNVASGTYAISSANAVTGNGTLKKTGAGTLDLTGLTGAAKVVVTEGKVLAGPNVTVVYDLEEDRGAVPVLMAE